MTLSWSFLLAELIKLFESDKEINKFYKNNKAEIRNFDFKSKNEFENFGFCFLKSVLNQNRSKKKFFSFFVFQFNNQIWKMKDSFWN